MFLRNFDNAMLLQLGFGNANCVTWGGQQIGELFFVDGNIVIKQTNGEVSKYYSHSSSGYLYTLLGLGVADICLGDGNTPVTYEDYKLSGNVVTNKLVKVLLNTTYDDTTREYTTKLVASYNNNETSAITIREWGLFSQNANNLFNKGTYSNNNKHILLYREVLDEPVVIEPGATTTLTFTLKVSLPHQPA